VKKISGARELVYILRSREFFSVLVNHNCCVNDESRFGHDGRVVNTNSTSFVMLIV
jgi:hypothetical protein